MVIPILKERFSAGSQIDTVMDRLQELAPDAEVEVLTGTFAGTSVGLVYVTVRTASIAAAGAVTESTDNDAEYQRLLQRLADTGRTLESRSLLSEISFD